MLITLITTMILGLSPPEKILFKLINTSPDPVIVLIEGLPDMIIPPNQERDLQLSVGVKIFTLPANAEEGEVPILVLAVQADMESAEVKIDKLVKKAIRLANR